MKNPRSELIIYFIYAAVLFTYLAIRSVLSGTLHDEAFSFLKYIHSNAFLPFTPHTPISANNHYLNSILTWLSYNTFGVSEWSIRLPNLLAFPIYMYYIFRLGKNLSRTYLRWLFWLLLTSAHYYLEFFAYSRGYGLSMAFLAGSIYFLVQGQVQENKSFTNLLKGLALIFLATFANLNLMVTLAIWIAIALVIIFLRTKGKRPFFLFLLCSLFPLVFLTFLALQLNSHEMSPIGESSFLQSLYSLISLYVGTDSSLVYVASLSLFAFILITGGHRLVKKRSFKITPLFALYSFFLLNILGSIILNLFIGVNYPVGRMAFHWYFFAAGCVPFVIDELKPALRPILSITVFLIFAPIILFTFKSLSFYSSVDAQWARQQISDDFFFTTKSINKDHDFPLSMYGPENFYTLNMAFKNLKFQGSTNVCNAFPSSAPVYSSDLLIVDTNRYPVHENNYEEVLYDPHSKMFLMRRSPLLEGVLVADSVIQSREYSTETFTALGNFNVHHLPESSTYRLNIDIEVKSDQKPLLSLITVEIRNNTNDMIFYEQISLDYHATDFSKGVRQQFSIVVHQLPKDAQLMRCFFWNYDEMPFKLNKAETSLYLLNNEHP